MYRIVEGNILAFDDTGEFVELINGLPAGLEGLFDPAADIFVTRAPGRLDVMGGIADYSGSLVLEMPLAEATFAAIQKSGDDVFKIVSLFGGRDRFSIFEMGTGELGAHSPPIEYKEIRRVFESDRSISWASYAAGVFFVLKRELGVDFKSGVRILISSNVPIGKGVSSSAALEVATMQAVCTAFEIAIEPLKMATLCQMVENEIVGAPCGVMDQIASHCGSANALISLHCQPARILGSLKIPKGIEFWGIDSGVRHSVSGSDYSKVRAGAFMGYRMIADIAGMKASTSTFGLVKVDDSQWSGYLANISPAQFENDFLSALPDEINGAEFLEKYAGTTDRFTKVEADKFYPVKAPTAHAIYENARVNRFSELLQGEIDGVVLDELGELMFESHASYTACGLGESGTDRIVDLARENRVGGVFGARITGGGCGGTVAILAREGSGSTVTNIAARYSTETGKVPYIFHGSSAGSAIFGNLKLRSIDESQTISC
jgi:L-arabinokinase